MTPGKTDLIIAEVIVGIREQIPRMVFDLRSRGEGTLAERMAEEWNDALVKSLETDSVDVNVQPGLDLSTRSLDGPEI